MAKNTASDELVRKANKEVQSCVSYLKKHFSSPNDVAELDAKRLAMKTARALAYAAKDRDLSKIVRHRKALAKVMVYLWALRQFPDHGSSHEQDA
jgi:hypothetical protein